MGVVRTGVAVGSADVSSWADKRETPAGISRGVDTTSTGRVVARSHYDKLAHDHCRFECDLQPIPGKLVRTLLSAHASSNRARHAYIVRIGMDIRDPMRHEFHAL